MTEQEREKFREEHLPKLDKRTFLALLAQRMQSSRISTKDFVQLSKTYAQVAGWTDSTERLSATETRMRKRVEKAAEEEGPTPQTIAQVVQKLEEEFKNGARQ